MVIEDLQDLQDYEAAVVGLEDQARHLLDDRTEAELPAIRAWRSAFAAMGVRPTQYRCAAEALLRRLRKDGALPRMTPLVDLCNALSAAHAVPVAAFDLDRIMGDLTVGPAAGSETYLSFGGQTEQPAAGEIVFVDAAGTVHARRWTHRQSATSAVSPATRRALIVIEGLHETAETDVAAALDALARIMSHHGTSVRRRLLRGGAGAFDMGAAA
ncbi:MAG: hypothetical protein GYB53_19305 [Rhodobacteraceae bacterium]|nr:hypothetical protein [Paracoccaceae bacterium]MBR9823570.1 hypothetical protein [Paracoccaceae bacterium]